MPYIRNRFIKNAVITADKMATSAAAAGGSTLAPGIPVVVALTIPDAAGDVDFVLPYKATVVDIVGVQVGTGNAGNSWTVKNGANVISSALNNASDTGVSRPTTLNPANATIALGGTLRVTVVKAGGAASGTIYVTMLKVA